MNRKIIQAVILFAVIGIVSLGGYFNVSLGNIVHAENQPNCRFTQNLYFGVFSEDVQCLQKYLNSTEFKVALTGFGSSGNETTFFGPLTRAAVSRWQEAHKVFPTAGFFGPISRAKYSAILLAGGSTPIPNPNPMPTTPPAVGGTVLSVIPTSNEPASTLVPQSAARVPFVTFNLVGDTDNDVTVRGITVELRGFANTAAFDRVILIDENKLQIGNARTFNTNRQLTFNESFVVPKGTTKNLTVAADTASSLSSYQGQTARMAVVGLEVSTLGQGAFQIPIDTPIMGNDMTLNSTLTIGSLSATRGSTDPGSALTKEVGSTNVTFAAIRVTAGSQEDISLEGMRWTQSGSAAPSDLANVRVIVDGSLAQTATVSADGKTYTALFPNSITIGKGAVKEVAIVGDINYGSLRNINFDIFKKTDIIARGKTFGYYVTTSGGTSGSAPEGNFSSDQEPFYNGYTLTISQGSLNVERASLVQAGSIAVGTSDAILGAFTLESHGETSQITKFILTLTVTGSGSASGISNITIYDENSKVVAGPKDASGSTVTFSDSWTVQTGKHNYTVHGKLSTAFANSDTVTISVTPSSDITARGETSGNTLTATPSSAVQASKQTVRASALTVSVASSPSAQTIVAGVSNVTMARFTFDASASGDDIRVSSLKLRDTYSSNAGATSLSNCRIVDNGNILNTGGNNVDPLLDGTSPDDISFVLDTQLTIAKGDIKTVNLTCNISGNATSASTHAWGINSSVSGAVSAYGITSGTTITPSIASSIGPTITIANKGALTVSLDSSSPSQRYAISGNTDNVMTVLKLEAKDEALRLNKIALILDTSTATLADIVNVTLWDGINKVAGSVITASTGKVTININQDFVVPKDGSKQLIVRADLAELGTNQPGTTGHLIAINYNGSDTTETEAVGDSSGTIVNPSASSNTNAGGVRLVKTYPIFESLPIPSNTLINGTEVLYRFKVAANTTGDVGLYKFTFLRTQSSVTLSNYSLYAYTDSGFSIPAYAHNPVNQTAASADGSGYIEIYFDPVSGSGNEAIQIPKGSAQTRYFELVANVSGASSGSSASMILTGDAAYYASGYTGTATAIDLDTNDNIIWSSHTSTVATPSTSDWLNGFRLPGLPSTGFPIQVLSR